MTLLLLKSWIDLCLVYYVLNYNCENTILIVDKIWHIKEPKNIVEFLSYLHHLYPRSLNCINCFTYISSCISLLPPNFPLYHQQLWTRNRFADWKECVNLIYYRNKQEAMNMIDNNIFQTIYPSVRSLMVSFISQNLLTSILFCDYRKDFERTFGTFSFFTVL